MRIETRLDSVYKMLEVRIDSDDNNLRPYYFNLPDGDVGRMAAVCETCVAEAIRRNEAWVSGKQVAFGGESSVVIETPSSAESDIQKDAPKKLKPKSKSAPVQKESADQCEPETAEEEPEAKPVPKRKKKEAAAKEKAPEPKVTPFSKAAECKKAFSAIVSRVLGKDWTKDADYKQDASEIARTLESESVPCIVDGEVCEAFEARVLEELEERYSF